MKPAQKKSTFIHFTNQISIGPFHTLSLLISFDCIEYNKETREFTAKLVLPIKDTVPSNVTIFKTDECPICFNNKSNVGLNCGHTFCNECLNEYYKVGNSCPNCKIKFNSCFSLQL